MKLWAAALISAISGSAISGCASGPLPWAQGTATSEPQCTASCEARYQQCPQVFAAFPQRGAVECPASHDDCLKSCRARAEAAAPSANTVPAVSSKETKLRQLKHLYDQGLVSDDVYKERQRAILAEP